MQQEAAQCLCAPKNVKLIAKGKKARGPKAHSSIAMAPAKASGQKKAKSANGYRLPDPIPAGEIVTGLTKKKSWRVGKSIGKQEQFQELFQIAHLQWV